MSPSCPTPNPQVGIAVRLTDYLDCQARVLGENGYLGFASGPVGSGLMTACLVILVALIGYRLILGSRPGLNESVGWLARVGIALALIGSWPAFETVIYRVVTDGPVEVANAVLQPSGLPSQDLPARVQMAYDTIRLGAAPASQTGDASPVEQRFQFQGAAPKTAVMFLVATVGLLSAIRIGIGFLLAIGLLPVLSILFAGGRGLLLGWIRILAGFALGAVGVTTVTAVELVLVESELGRLQAFRTGAGEIIDPQALTAIVVTGLIMAALALMAAVRAAARVEFQFASFGSSARSHRDEVRDGAPAILPAPTGAVLRPAVGPAREREIAQSLLMTTRREQANALPSTFKLLASAEAPSDRGSPALAGTNRSDVRRRTLRRTRSSMRREARR